MQLLDTVETVGAPTVSRLLMHLTGHPRYQRIMVENFDLLEGVIPILNNCLHFLSITRIIRLHEFFNFLVSTLFLILSFSINPQSLF